MMDFSLKTDSRKSAQHDRLINQMLSINKKLVYKISNDLFYFVLFFFHVVFYDKYQVHANLR